MVIIRFNEKNPDILYLCSDRIIEKLNLSTRSSYKKRMADANLQFIKYI